VKVVGGVLLAGLVLCASPRSAAAQAAPDEQRSTGYYVGHSGAILALLGAAFAANTWFKPHKAGCDFSWFPGDCSLRGNCSPLAARVSDVTLGVTVVDPVVASAVQGFDWRLVNRGVVYAETLAVNLAVNTIVKVSVARPRPYTHLPQCAADQGDPYVSFYSGHSSTAFSAALTGSYLFSESIPARGWRYTLWGSEFFLAAVTANLRLRAGKHYYSDVLLGAVVGMGFGIGTLLLHGANYRPEGGEYALAIGGVGLGTVVAQVLPFPSSALPGATASAGLDSLTLLPWSLGNEAVGVQALGTF
jgi:membrane-associated phospholipid phosphatase